MTFFVIFLIIVQIFLIVNVVINVNRVRTFYEESNNDGFIVLNQQTDVVEKDIESQKNIYDTCRYSRINKEANGQIVVLASENGVNRDLEKMINEIVKKKIIESQERSDTAFSSIMLSMITLCITLAVVVPYVISKSITINDVQEVVEKHNKLFGVKLNETVKNLEWAEAHTSRIIAYILLNKNQINPDWAIGWASKSLIRYLKQDMNKPWIDEFCNDCIKYISEGQKMLKDKASNVDEEHMLRAIKDAYDALGMISNSKTYFTDLETEQSIMNGIKYMFNYLVSEKKYSKNKIIKDIAKASKYKLYMGENTTVTEFRKKFLSDLNEK